jgi:hypothetical protein
LLLGRGDTAELRVTGRQRGVLHRIRRRDALQRLDRFAVAAGREAGPPERVSDALGVIGIQAHRLPELFDPLVGRAEPGQELALLDDDEVVDQS